MTGPSYATVPVRFIVGAGGKIEHVHVIAGFPEQAKSVPDALAKWDFKPYELVFDAASKGVVYGNDCIATLSRPI